MSTISSLLFLLLLLLHLLLHVCRIRITGPVEVQVEDSNETAKVVEEKEEEEERKPEEQKGQGKRTAKRSWWKWGEEEEEEEEEEVEVPKKRPILMVRTENVEHKPFKQTEEVKALTAEVIKTIRDIVALNPLYR